MDGGLDINRLMVYSWQEDAVDVESRIKQ